MCAVIDKTAMVLHVVGLNIGVESCASLESRAMFQIFVEEIKLLSKKMNAISQNIRDDSSQSYNNQQMAHQKIMGGLVQLQTLTQAAEKTVGQAVTRINQLMALSYKGLEKAGAISKEIYHQVGEIVIAIQFHDITRQQIEHIADALKDVEHLMRDPVLLNKGRANRPRILGKAYSILLLQLEQLKHVITEIDNAHQKVETAFEKIGREIQDLVGSLNPTDTGKDRDEAETDPFLALKAGLENLAGLFNQGRELSRQMEQIADQASAAAATLTKHIDRVRGIGMDLHLKALNAIVKTAHLNDKGKTLEVLAQEVNRLSNQSITFVDNVVGVLELITALAKNLAQHTWSKSAALSGGETGGAKDTLAGGIAAVTGAYDRFKEDTQTALKYSEDLESSIRQIRCELGFLSTLSARLNSDLASLQDLVNNLAAWSHEAHPAAAHEIKDLSARYTMQKERDIHDELFSNAQPALPPPAPVAEPAEPAPAVAARPVQPDQEHKKEDLGDNVELF
jgi:methyl-accepting chemotaxis protein